MCGGNLRFESFVPNKFSKDISFFLGPSLFYSCPMDFKVAEGWFVNVWNYNVIPYLHQTLRSGRKVFQDVSFL